MNSTTAAARIIDKNQLAIGDFWQLEAPDKNHILSLLSPISREAEFMIRQGVYLNYYPEVKQFILKLIKPIK